MSIDTSQVLSLIDPFIIAKGAGLKADHLFINLCTDLQSAKPSDIVFYKLNIKDNKSWSIFKERLLSSHSGLLILDIGAGEADNNFEITDGVNYILVKSENFLAVQKILSDELFPNKNKMKLVGVTGTNGKTTTVNLSMQLATMIGHAAISVGTIGVCDSSNTLKADVGSTTPSYIELRKLIFEYQEKYEVCFLEVSSHALAQDRLYDLRLEGAAWTSFSQDHLDYHRTMENYFEAKLLIVKKYLKKGQALLVSSLENKLIEAIIQKIPKERLKISKTLDQRGIGTGLEERPLFYHSAYNQSNIEIALQLNADLFGEEKIKNISLKNIQTPPGRFSIIELANESLAIIDYAHTPDALENIGRAIRHAFPDHFLTVVFGCGGNRDKTKRPMMGKVVMGFADKVIITSDNPRDEPPEDIIMEILRGVSGSYEAVVDRQKAILAALVNIKPKEIILIAGKGHEQYQEIMGVKYPFSDFNIVINFKAGI